MKWITRERAKVDRIACPWLIRNFVDKDAEFIFAPAHKIVDILAKQQDQIKTTVIPFDIPNVELGHHGEECSFDAIIKKYGLDKKYPALVELAKIVRGADTPNRSLTSYSECLAALAAGFSIISKDDYDNMAKQFHVYDALYAFCKSEEKRENYCPLDTDIFNMTLGLLSEPLRAKTDIPDLIRPDGNYAKQEKIRSINCTRISVMLLWISSLPLLGVTR